jgi:hypothetical protein
MGKKIKITRIIDVSEMGRAGGKATAQNRTPAERRAAARKAIAARWDAYYKEHPEKLKTRRSGASRKKKTSRSTSDE